MKKLRYNPSDSFFSEKVRLINGKDKEAFIGKANIGEVPNNLEFSDSWSNVSQKPNSTGKIDNVNFDDLLQTPEGIVYDQKTNRLKFVDESLIKFDDYGCALTNGEITLEELTKNVRLVEFLDRINFLGSVYDFQFKQINYGKYKYSNAYNCNVIANSYGYLSVDKIINDEFKRKQRQNELNERYSGTPQEEKYPPYSGFLEDESFIQDGWISLDYMIQKTMEDENAYDDEWSIGIRTKSFDDRKKLSAYLLLNYASSILEMGSYNKITDFGVRIVERLSGQELDRSQVINNLIKKVAYNVALTYSGDMDDIEEADEETIARSDICVGDCEKVYINKCTGELFKVLCKQSNNEDNEVEEGEPLTVSRLIEPQFRINAFHENRELDNNDDYHLNTIDPINWTTGLSEDFDSKFLELIDEFGEDIYKSTHLNEDRGFAFGSGDFSDGIVVGGVKNNTNSFGNVSSTEIWNGTSWRVHNNNSPQLSLGLIGGDSHFSVIGLGASSKFGNDNIPSIKPSNQFSIFEDGEWKSANIDCSENFHSVSGIIIVNSTKNVETVNDEIFDSISINGIDIKGCSNILDSISEKTDEQQPSLNITNFSGFFYNGSRGNLFLDNISCSDLNDNFYYFSYVDLEENTLEDPIECENEKIIIEEYKVDGLKHRDDGPAVVYIDEEGIRVEEYWDNGVLTRDISSGPAIKKFFGDEDIEIGYEYLVDGIRTSPDPDNIPSLLEKSKDGEIITREEYWDNGVNTRTVTAGPALIEREYCPVDVFSLKSEKYQCCLRDITKSYPIKTIGTKYVGDDFSGLSTGGKTCNSIVDCSELNSKLNYYYGYNSDERYNEFENSISNLVYEFTGTTWIRRDNLPENVAYHAGVGDVNRSIYWGGIHGSLENINVYSYVPGCDLWDGFVDSFGGVFCKEGILGINGEVRYSDFSTILRDELNKYYKFGDSRYNGNLYVESLNPTATNDFIDGVSPVDYISEFSDQYKKSISYVKDNVIEVVEYTGGEGRIVNLPKRIKDIEVIAGENNNLIESYIKSISAEQFDGTFDPLTGEISAFDYGVFAKKDNYLNNLESGYSTHPTTGGLWLWSRPNIGERLFHPESLSISGESYSLKCEKYQTGFSTTQDCSSFPQQTKTYYVDENANNLEQFFWKDRQTFVEYWDNTRYEQLLDDSIFLKRAKEVYEGSISTGNFVVDKEKLRQTIDYFISLHSNNETIYDDIAFQSNLQYFDEWFNSTDDHNFKISSYDNLKDYFKTFSTITSGTSSTNSTGSSGASGTVDILNNVKVYNSDSSTIRDRAALFPWNDLLKGNPENLLKEGDITWCWSNEDIIIAEVVESGFVGKDEYYDPLRRTLLDSDKNDNVWREKVTIKCLDKEDNVKFTYTIIHDMLRAKDFSDETFVSSNDNLDYENINMDIFGTSLKPRIVNKDVFNGLYINKSSGSCDQTIFNVGWNKKSYILENENSKKIRLNLCDTLEIDDDRFISSDTGIFCSISGSNITGSNIWPWSVPLKEKNTNLFENFFITNDVLDSSISGDSQIINSQAYLNGQNRVTQVSQGFIFGPNNNGLFNTNIGKSSAYDGDLLVNSLQHLIFDENNQSAQKPSYEKLRNSFPWNVIGHDGELGPKAYVDLFDENGNYWLALGDKNNININDINENVTYKNIYTIIKINSDKISEIEKTINSKINLKLANMSKEYVDDTQELFINIRGTRFVEGIKELLNNEQGHNLFELQIRLIEERVNDRRFDSYLSHFPQRDTEQNIIDYFLLPESNIYEVPKIYPTQVLDINNNDNCLTCFVCNDNLPDSKWNQHIREEWIAPYLESPIAGVFSREGFNIWINAGQRPRWGSNLWIEKDDGSILFNHLQVKLGIDIDRDILYVLKIKTSFNIESFKDSSINITQIPAKIIYDEYHFNYSDYKDFKEISDLIDNDNVTCNDTLIEYVPNYFVESGSLKCVDPLSDLSYTEWATNFIQEYRKSIFDDDGSLTNKYYNKYDVFKTYDSNTLISLPEICNESPLLKTEWRRYQDGVGLGGDNQILNTDNIRCIGLAEWAIGQVAFGNPTRAIIAGGFITRQDAEPSISKTWYEKETSSYSFKWNKNVINPEDYLNKNYENRNFSPFFGNGDRTNALSNFGVVLFDLSEPVIIERQGTALFEQTNEFEVQFLRPIPEFLNNKDKYSITLSCGENVKCWWENKTETGFIIKVELDSWSGAIDWNIILREELPKEEYEKIKNTESFGKFEEI